MTEPLRPCIYCRSTACAKTSEHVLNKAFRANLTLANEVCHDCNDYFSSFDTQLYNYVRTLDPLRKHPALESHDLMFFNGQVSLAYYEEKGFWFAVRIDTRQGTWNRVPLQQIIIISPTTIAYVDEPRDERQSAVRYRIMETELLRSDIKFRYPEWRMGDGRRPPQTIVARSGKDTYAIVGESAERDQEITDQIRSRALAARLKAVSRTPMDARAEDPNISIRAQFRSLAVPLAKIAFNFACAALGFETIQRSEFDRVRRAVRYSEQAEIDFVTQFWEEDQRQEVMGSNRVLAALCASPGHSIMLCARPGEPLVATIVLFEQIVAYVELLRGDETGWMDQTVCLGLFDYNAKISRILKMPEDYPDFLRLFGEPCED